MNEMIYAGEHQLLGEILVGNNKLEAKQLERALSHQAAVSSRIGEILVTLGYIGEDDLIAALAQQLALPVYRPEPGDEFLAAEVAAAFHREHPFALVKRGGEGEKPLLLVGNPLDGDLLAALAVVFPHDYELQLTSESGPEVGSIVVE